VPTTTAALPLLDPRVAGTGLTPQPACHGAPGKPAGHRTPAMCVHADRPPAGVDVHRPVGLTELTGRTGAGAAATRAPAAELGRAAPAASTPPVSTPASSAVQCYGTGSDGNRVQAIYAVEQGRPNRYSSVLASIRTWAAGVDSVLNRSAALTGGTRYVRFVTGAGAGGCTPTVLNVTLPTGASADFDATMTALQAKGFSSPHRKYLVWTDASVLCGIASVYQDSIPATSNYNNGMAAQFARIDAGCWGYPESVEAHELVHTLGSVQPDAPHHTDYGHCFDEYDRMCYDDGSGIAMQSICPPAHDALLDCGGDDYFSTAPTPGGYLATHWNTASSGFLSGTGSLRVAVATSTMVPGLPSAISASVTLQPGHRLVALTFRTTTAGCTVTRTSISHARLLCPAGLSTAAAVRVTAVDSTGQSTTATVRPALSLVARPATLQFTVDGQAPAGAAWCATTGTLRARLVDDATGTPVAGLPVTFGSSPTQGGSRTPLGTPVTRPDGVALLRATLAPVFLHADVSATGPWPGTSADSAQALTISACSGMLTATLPRSKVGYGDRLLLRGTLRGSAAGHLVPLPGQNVTVLLRSRGRAVVLGHATVTDAGTWQLSPTATTAGWIVAVTGGSAAVTGATTTAGAVTVLPWATAATATGKRARSAGRYLIAGTALRAARRRIGVAGLRIRIWYTPPRRSARVVATAVTSSRGAFAIRIRGTSRGLVRIEVLPAPGYRGSRSAAVRLR
jgi:hypothetical protein